MRLRVGPAGLPRPRGHARPAARPRPARSASGSTRTSPSARRCSREGVERRLPGAARPTAASGSGTCGRPGMALVDFTNPDARAWFPGKLAALLDQGVDAIKTDFGERIPHRRGLARRLRPRADAQLLHRSSTTGRSSRCSKSVRGAGRGGAVRPLGDRRRPAVPGALGRRQLRRRSTSMAESLRGGLSLAAQRVRLLEPRHRRVRGHPDPAVFKRWLAFGLLSTPLAAARLHELPGAVGVRRRGAGRARSRWRGGSRSSSARCMPYLVAAGEEAHRDRACR